MLKQKLQRNNNLYVQDLLFMKLFLIIFYIYKYTTIHKYYYILINMRK